mmetsp:Transcript_42703/g.110029  ORF Transcript_42703/g.110029 Transcript_42703/m.110029 type:complete len:212 (-) Transcript_42703:813-1448(-)
MQVLVDCLAHASSFLPAYLPIYLSSPLPSLPPSPSLLICSHGVCPVPLTVRVWIRRLRSVTCNRRSYIDEVDTSAKDISSKSTRDRRRGGEEGGRGHTLTSCPFSPLSFSVPPSASVPFTSLPPPPPCGDGAQSNQPAPYAFSTSLPFHSPTADGIDMPILPGFSSSYPIMKVERTATAATALARCGGRRRAMRILAICDVSTSTLFDSDR